MWAKCRFRAKNERRRSGGRKVGPVSFQRPGRAQTRIGIYGRNGRRRKSGAGRGRKTAVGGEVCKKPEPNPNSLPFQILRFRAALLILLRLRSALLRRGGQLSPSFSLLNLLPLPSPSSSAQGLIHSPRSAPISSSRFRRSFFAFCEK